MLGDVLSEQEKERKSRARDKLRDAKRTRLPDLVDEPLEELDIHQGHPLHGHHIPIPVDELKLEYVDLAGPHSTSTAHMPKQHPRSHSQLDEHPPPNLAMMMHQRWKDTSVHDLHDMLKNLPKRGTTVMFRPMLRRPPAQPEDARQLPQGDFDDARDGIHSSATRSSLPSSSDAAQALSDPFQDLVHICSLQRPRQSVLVLKGLYGLGSSTTRKRPSHNSPERGRRAE
ncbi:hypothetical protein M405DRAFT_938319 [Rhizopogon salebrosus TDB-379]|nr:hypothetical protein M405DRAFT_938319 [Rhizopogon salebrosus TDB-379]